MADALESRRLFARALSGCQCGALGHEHLVARIFGIFGYKATCKTISGRSSACAGRHAVRAGTVFRKSTEIANQRPHVFNRPLELVEAPSRTAFDLRVLRGEAGETTCVHHTHDTRGRCRRTRSCVKASTSSSCSPRGNTVS